MFIFVHPWSDSFCRKQIRVVEVAMKHAMLLFICTFTFFMQAAYAGDTGASDKALPFTVKTFDYNQDGVAIKLRYPEIPGIGRQYSSIDKQIKRDMLTIRFPGKATAQTFADTRDFVRGIKRFIMRNGFKGYEFFSGVEVAYNASNIFTVKILNYEMPYGAANGLNSIIYLNFNTGTGRRFTINDCFSDRAYQALVRRGKDLFVEKAKADGVFDLVDNQFLDRFYLPVNFAVTDSGVEFAYRQYEVGPRPLGMPAFTIPRGEIRALIDKGCPLQRYFYQ
ncbi:MAG: hypothetical protein A4E64_00568 [Syntrophorhabdus sp. PtaU1.Bin058]|nr:MAG: hypothetical protein A4E64_00568 [Syntrophorhabdus sp. PtaU1.Bin058]